jgi:hypothetical protein
MARVRPNAVVHCGIEVAGRRRSQLESDPSGPRTAESVDAKGDAVAARLGEVRRWRLVFSGQLKRAEIYGSMRSVTRYPPSVGRVSMNTSSNWPTKTRFS